MPAPSVILNFALSQADRSAQATNPSRVRVDDRSLAQLLCLAVEHGKLITFYDLTNAPDRDWSDLFASDPAIALAMQASLDPNVIEQEMQAIGRRLRQDDRPLVRPEPWRDLVALIRQLLTTMRRRPLRDGPLAMLLLQIDSPVALVDTATNLSRFLESTGLDLRLGVQAILLKESELRRMENLLRDFLGVLLATLDTMRQDAERDLQLELARPGHAPHVALYIAFARLFQSMQARLNRFPDSLLTFYHQEVLRQVTIADSSLRPDHLLLAFRLKPGADPVVVPRQTPFLAGVDGAGLPITYTTDQDLEVQGGVVEAMVAMRLRGRAIEADGLGRFVAIDGVWVTEMALPLPYPSVGPLLPLFGPDQPRQTPYGVTSSGVLGFAIGSPLLALEGGQRLVTLTLRITAVSLQGLAAFSQHLDRDALRERLRQILEQDLRWAYTTSEGLESLSPKARILAPGEEASGVMGSMSATVGTVAWEPMAIELAFLLPPSSPPWRECTDWGAQPLLLARLQEPCPASPGVGVATAASSAPVDASVSGSAPTSLAPSSTSSAAPEAQEPLTTMAMLSLLNLEALALVVAVHDLPPNDLRSSVGRLDPSQPLPIFGPSPVCGSFFSVGAPELAAKPLDAITLRLQWHGLPISRDGFRGHYSGYRLDGDGQLHPPGELFTNSCFQVDLHLDMESSPEDGSPGPITLPLFESASPLPATTPMEPTPLAPTTDLKRSDLKGVCGVRALRLVLSAPLYAFGDALYASNCLEASRRLAPASTAAGPSPSPVPEQPTTASAPTWPNPPWCPSVASVRVDYRSATAVASFPVVETTCPPPQLFHLSPLNGCQPVTWHGDSGIPLLPRLMTKEMEPLPKTAAFPVELHLATVHLTLTQSFHQLSLLFGLTLSGTVDSFRPTPQLHVDVWIAGQWQALPDTAVQDGTSGLSRTGILLLTLPDDQNTSCLRLRLSGLSDPLPDLVCLEPNAAWATWKGPGGKETLNRSLEAGKVTTSLEILPAIAEIRQPLPSSGGVAPAGVAMEKVCLAERLRHKERAIQADDYALLLLRAFPVLWQVAVLAARNAKGESEAGCVTIIPIPGPESPTIPDPTIPSCDGAFSELLLTELKSSVSPFARLQVACPAYCRVIVCATVVVEDARLSSSLQQLQADLLRFLSPWPAPDLGPRAQNYYEESVISEFIRDRSYIKSIDNLSLKYNMVGSGECLPAPPPVSVIYYTSAQRHELTARPASVSLVSFKDGG